MPTGFISSPVLPGGRGPSLGTRRLRYRCPIRKWDISAESALNDDLRTRPDTPGLSLRDLPVPFLETDREVTGHLRGCPSRQTGPRGSIPGVRGPGARRERPGARPRSAHSRTEPRSRPRSGSPRRGWRSPPPASPGSGGPVPVPKVRSTRPFAWGEPCEDHLDPQLTQRSGDDRISPLLLLRQPPPEVSGVVRVDSQGAAVAPRVSDDRPAVLRTVVALDEASHHQPARRIVMDRDQHLVAATRSSSHACTELSHCSSSPNAARRGRRAAVPDPSALSLPRAGLHHPAPQRVQDSPAGRSSCPGAPRAASARRVLLLLSRISLGR